MTGESRKGSCGMDTTRRDTLSGVRGEGRVGETNRGGGDTAAEEGGLLEDGVVAPRDREKSGVCVQECAAGVCGDNTLKELVRLLSSSSVLGV